MNECYNKLDYFKEIEKIPPKIYYHYTSLDALYEIINTHTFRLMSLKSTNDRSELSYKPEEFIEDFSRICNSKPPINNKENWDLLNSSLDENLKSFMKSQKSKKQPYALCMASNGDSLTHWTRYANDGKGVSIGFNVRCLDVLYKRMNSEAFGTGYFDFGRVLYNNSQIEEQILSDVKKGFLWIEHLCKNTNNKDFGKIVMNSGHIFLASSCSNVMKFAKNSAFIDEDEFRLYYDPQNKTNTLKLIDSVKDMVDKELYVNTRKHFLEIGKVLNIDEEGFASTKTGIRCYRNLCLSEVWGTGAIPEIRLGPMCPQSKKELHKFLTSKGLRGIDVKRSVVPLR